MSVNKTELKLVILGFVIILVALWGGSLLMNSLPDHFTFAGIMTTILTGVIGLGMIVRGLTDSDWTL